MWFKGKLPLPPLSPLSTFFSHHGFPIFLFPVIFISLFFPPAACFTLVRVFYFPFLLFSSLPPPDSLFCLFVPSQSVTSLDFCLFQLFRTDGRSQGYGVLSGWGDGLQGSGLYQRRHPATPSLLPLHPLSLPLHSANRAFSLSDVHTNVLESLAFLLGLSGVYVQYVYASADRMRFCGERRPPEWGREQIGV